MSGRVQARGRGRGKGGGRGNSRGKGGRGRGQVSHRHNSNNNRSKDDNDSTKRRRKILLLHGNRQTGELLLGRMDKLKKTLLRECQLEIVAPDAPHLFSDDDELDCDDINGDDTSSSQWQRTWWHRKDNAYYGLEKSLSLLEQIWNDDGEFVTIMGFSQGSRLAHIIAILHTITKGVAFPGLKSVVHFSGYGDVTMPDNFYTLMQEKYRTHISQSTLMKLSDNSYQFDDILIDRPSLHVMGETDKLIPLESSEALLKWYNQPSVYVHPGNHFVPVKKVDIDRYLQFFNDADMMNIQSQSIQSTSSLAVAADEYPSKTSEQDTTAVGVEKDTVTTFEPPGEEHAQAQIDEVTALAQIFPTEFNLISHSTPTDPDSFDPDDYSEENRRYEHPIKYSILLQPQDSAEEIDEKLWPPKNIHLCVQYPSDYPDSSPTISLIHKMNYFEFSLQASEALLDAARKAMEEEFGMPCVMGMIYAARDFFEGGGLATCVNTISAKKQSSAEEARGTEANTAAQTVQSLSTSLLQPSSTARIQECNAQGLQVASTMLGRAQTNSNEEAAATDGSIAGGKGGRWMYTVGLVGKPSAGKSTFFNAATCFARQRGEGGGEARCEDADIDDEESEVILGGASMAPHPFTTIDPNIGYCLVPAPQGACPEDDEDCQAKLLESSLVVGSTHGRDSKGRRLLPVLLKDVAGLVPGAYQGRGRGNKFLDDLTDADVLIHVVNASGSSDAEGNDLHNDLVNPINDLQWVRNELVEWVYFNLSSKWDSVLRRGRQKLIGMFSGYKQREAFTYDVLLSVERFVKEKEGRERIFDDLGSIDEGDLHRLVSAFLGARFPMALALNKSDLPSATKYIQEIQSKLPIHGAHVGVSMSAHSEMAFIRHHLLASSSQSKGSNCEVMSGRVFDCLQAAMALREPTLVFPVNDFITYEPLPGMANYSTRDSSLPNHGFISCVCAAGGSAPSQWDNEKKVYLPSTKSDAKPALRDVVMMKQNSTVEDVFRSLKGMSVLEGDFVRAEGASKIGEKPKPLSKGEVVGQHNRILRIMTTKRQVWQQK